MGAITIIILELTFHNRITWFAKLTAFGMKHWKGGAFMYVFLLFATHRQNTPIYYNMSHFVMMVCTCVQHTGQASFSTVCSLVVLLVQPLVQH